MTFRMVNDETVAVPTQAVFKSPFWSDMVFRERQLVTDHWDQGQKVVRKDVELFKMKVPSKSFVAVCCFLRQLFAKT